MWQALGSPGQHRGASEGRALGPKSLRVTNGKGKGNQILHPLGVYKGEVQKKKKGS